MSGGTTEETTASPTTCDTGLLVFEVYGPNCEPRCAGVRHENADGWRAELLATQVRNALVSISDTFRWRLFWSRLSEPNGQRTNERSLVLHAWMPVSVETATAFTSDSVVQEWIMTMSDNAVAALHDGVPGLAHDHTLGVRDQLVTKLRAARSGTR